MATITLNPGSGGELIATDEIGGTNYQKVKLTYGADGTATDLKATTPLPVRDARLEIARNNVTGQKRVHVNGSNQAVGVTEEDFWPLGGAYNWMTTASPIRVKAGGNANDTAGGTGAREITFEGLDSNFDEATEAEATAGASASAATTTNFIRLNRTYVSSAGTYTGNNTGNVFVEDTSGTTDRAIILAGIGHAESCMYTVPNGKKAYLVRWSAQVSENQTGNVFLYYRENADVVSTPYGAKLLLGRMTEYKGARESRIEAFWEFPGKTDIWLAGQSNSGNTEMTGEIDLIVVDD